MNDDYLSHYGVVGMKWGVRKKSRTKRSGISGKKDKLSYKAKAAAKRKIKTYSTAKKAEFKAVRKNRAEVKRYDKLKKKKVSKLSNEQLVELSKRYELESKVLNSQKAAGNYNTGKKEVQKFLADSVKQAAKPVIVKAGTYAVNRIIKDTAGIKEPINWAEFADFVAPTKDKKKKDKKDDD